MFAFLLAVSLSSSNLDEFFTLPNWFKDSAASYNTPGSDPDNGSGWYIHEYTNRVDFSAWRWKLDGDWTHADQQWMIYQGDGVWNIGSIAAQMISEAGGRIVPPDCTIHVLIPLTIQGDEDAANLTWTSTCVYQRNGSQEYSSTNLYIEAIRDKTVTPIPTGRGKPRAARLTPEVQAGVLSTFAAYHERQYYSMQGQTNGWEQGELWPQISKKRFNFAPTNGVDSYSEFLYIPKDRKIESRRLLEYDNIKRLGDFILDWGNSGFSGSSCYRPSTNIYLMYDTPTSAVTNIVEYITWHNGYMWDSVPSMFWASTDDKVFDGTSIVPSFSWVSDPTADSSQWAKCCQTFKCLDYDYIWYTHYYITDFYQMPTVRLLDKVDLGGYKHNLYDCRPAPIPVTMKQMIETNFPHADGWAITNNARRLLSDSLCCMNQALSLMDRTYHIPTINYPHSATNIYAREVVPGSFIPVTNIVCVATNISFGNSVSCRGEIYRSSAEGSYGTITVKFDDQEIQWDAYSRTNSTSGYNLPFEGNYIGKFISKTGTRTHYSNPFGKNISVTEEQLKDAASGVGLNGEYRFSISGNSTLHNGETNMIGSATIYFYKLPEGVLENTATVSIDFGPIPSKFEVWYSYGRHYRYEYTTRYPTLGLTQPGWQGVNGRADCKYGALAGVSFESTEESSDLTTQYKSYTGSANNHQSLEAACHNIADDIYGKFQQQYSIDPMNWRAIIPLDMNDVNMVRNSITNGNMFITAGNNGSLTEGRISGGGGSYEVTNVVTYDNSGGHEGFGAGSKIGSYWEYTKREAEQEESDGLTMKGKIGIITRTDWDWKTLKRD